MLEAVIIGSGRSMPGLFSMRRKMRRLRRFNGRWTLAFTRKPPGVEQTRGVRYLDCSRKPGGFRASQPQNALDYAWLRIKTAPEARPPEQSRTAARGRGGQFACPAFRCLNQPAALSRSSAISCEYLPSDPAHT